MKLFGKMTVIGVGLLGASLAKACKERGLVEEITGYGRNRENLEKARALKIIDHCSTDLAEAVKDADLIVLCTPVTTIIPLIQNMISEIRPGTLITDVGSVKEPIVKEAEKLVPEGVFFVGSHPIAGGENSGLEASTANLYQDAKCIVTPTGKTNNKALEKISALWQAVGMQVINLPAEEHDFVFGAVSHLPHIVAGSSLSTMCLSTSSWFSSIPNPGLSEGQMAPSWIAGMGVMKRENVSNAVWTDSCRYKFGVVIET